MKLYISKLTLPGSLLQGENPQPRFRAKEGNAYCTEDGSLREEERIGYGVGCNERTLPYRMQDRYERSDELVTLKTIVMENEHLKAVFLPGYGGKLWSLFSKDENRELLFENPVFRIANLATLNAWTSGGIEWNIGHTGHSVFTCNDMYCAKVQAPDGETFLRIYEYEAAHSQVFQMDFHLPSGAKELGVYVRIENPRNTDVPLYWWTNTAIKLTPHTRVFSGTSEIIYQLTPDPLKSIPGFAHCQMPEQPNLKGVDLSFPWKIPYSLEYFFQNKRDQASPWEVSIEEDGTGFMERSTQPLFARKLFCWGTGVGGKHWCDYLSTKGTGDYVEIQAGLAPTQMHTSILPANGIVEFTQVFGAFNVSKEAQAKEWNDALTIVANQVEHIIPADHLGVLNKLYKAKSTLLGEEILHNGGYYGGLESTRRCKNGEKPMASHLYFPLPDLESPYRAWLELLDGKLPPESKMPIPYVTDPLWLPFFEKALGQEQKTEQSLFQYAVNLAENGQQEKAEEVLHSLLTIHNPWAIHALGVLAKRDNAALKAAKFFELAYELEANQLDPSFAEEAMAALLKIKKYEKAFVLFEAIPENKKTEKEVLLAAEAAVKLEKMDFLEQVFKREYASIREGNVGLAEIWFEYKARLKAREEGVAFVEGQIDYTLDLPQELDFRMFEG